MGKWKLNSSLEEWESIADAITEEMEQYGLSLAFITAMQLAMDEVFANISMYAYADATGQVEVESSYGEEAGKKYAAIVWKDSGIKFNPLEVKEPEDLSEKAGKRKIGGLGIFIIKKQVDQVAYQYQDGMNILMIRKYEKK